MTEIQKKKFSDEYFDTREHYKDTNVAEKYDEIRFRSLSGRVFDKLEKNAVLKGLSGIPKGSKIADCPCGTGRHAEALLEAGYDVVGMDISPAMLEVAQKKLARFGDRFTTRVVDAMNVEEETKEFEAAICVRVLMHFDLPDQAKFLKGVSKMVRSTIVFNQGHDTPWFRFRRKIKKLLGHQLPARSPLSDGDIAALLTNVNLSEKSRHRVLPIVSEALVVSANVP